MRGMALLIMFCTTLIADAALLRMYVSSCELMRASEISIVVSSAVAVMVMRLFLVSEAAFLLFERTFWIAAVNARSVVGSLGTVRSLSVKLDGVLTA